MLLTVFCVPRDRAETTFALEVSPELELRDFVALCELESGIPAGEIQISYAQQPLRELTRSLESYGLKDGDVVVLKQAERRPAAQPTFPGLPRIDFSSIAVPGTSSNPRTTAPAVQPRAPQTSQAASSASSPTSPQGLDNPAMLRDMLLANPHELSLLKERNPPLAEALLSGDLERFTKVLLEQQQDRAKREQERIRLLTADPFDLEAQAKIEEDIRQHNIEENMTIAMEEAPESFGQVVMLYINCKVNGHPVKAFVDSGAQMTIMSQACAERCNIMRLVDRRWAGIAKGVGTQKIIGRVHLAQVQIEGDFLPCSFSILEDQPMDMLLGLDMLKRHQCSIDLKKSVLLIGTTGTETRFLPEAELPDCARLAYGPEGREDTRPEEIADRELAEALQRSVQDSDTADGTTTSPQPPSLTTSSSTPSQSRSFTLDRSKSAPASIHQSLPPETSFGVSQTQGETKSHSSFMQDVTENHPADVERPAPTLDEFLQNHPNDQAFNSQPMTDATMPDDQATDDFFPHVLPTQEPFSSTVSNYNKETSLVTGGESLNELNGGENNILQETESTEPPFTQTDACFQEVDMAESADQKMTSPDIPDQFQEKEQGDIMKNAADSQDDRLSSLTMHYNLPGLATSSEQNPIPLEFEKNKEESPVSKTAMNSERNLSECDNVPSLAQALKELHSLLMSNAQASGSSTPSVSSITTSPDNDGVDQAVTTVDYPRLSPTADSSHTGTVSEANFATSKPDTLSDDGKVKIMTVSSQGQEGNHVNQFTNSNFEEDRTQCSGFLERNQAGRGLVSETVDVPPLRSHQGEENEDRLTFVYNPPDTVEPLPQRLLSVADGPVADSSNLLPVESSHPSVQEPEVAPHPIGDSIQRSTVPLIGQYPAEHIQRIQAAGFSPHEAAEALEQAEGIVELALLVLLARNITVPT